LKHFHIKAFDIQDSWFQLLYNIFDYGRLYTIDKGSFEGQQRLEYDFATVHIKNPGNRPLIPSIPESLGIEPPTSLEYVESYFTDYLMNPELRENEEYKYSSRIDISLDKVINMLKSTPNTNQAVIEIAYPEDIDMIDPACLRLLQFKIINNKLIMYVVMRSNDLWAGYPSNIAGFQLLKEYMVSEIGCEDGDIFYTCHGLHLYDYCFDIAKTRVYK